MDTNKIIELFENGWIHELNNEESNHEKVWSEHPVFKGVFLKHLIKGQQSQGKFSSHLVHIKPGCSIGEHIHAGITELHEVIKGNGKCFLNDKEIEYHPGDCTIIPDDIKHEVIAGSTGLFLLAKFFPALL